MRRSPPDCKLAARTLARKQGGRIAWFVLVGCCAAIVHWSVVVGIVHYLGWRALNANVVGWMVAFLVSFFGHHKLSFRGHGSTIKSSGLRFLAVSAGGFLINEIAYAVLLGGDEQDFELVLASVLAGVAVLTYLLSRHWAFLRSQASD